MLKRIGQFLGVVFFIFFLTGCVKFNANMEIKKDKSMNFSIIYALDSSLFGEQELLKESDKKDLKDKGFQVEDYSDNEMKGFKISRAIQNIDGVSSSKDTSYRLSGILDEDSDQSIFRIKKGIFKNTYIAKFDFDASDSELNTANDSSNEDNSSDTTIEDEDDFDSSLFDDEDSDDSLDSDNSLDNDFNMDFSSMTKNMDLSFNVVLPYSARSNNATSTTNDNKNLKWSLSSDQVDKIEFTFELYNMGNIYLGIFLFIVIVIGGGVFFISRKRRKNKRKEKEVTQKMKETSMEVIENCDNTNSLVDEKSEEKENVSIFDDAKKESASVFTEKERSQDIFPDVSLADTSHSMKDEQKRHDPIFPPYQEDNTQDNLPWNEHK